MGESYTGFHLAFDIVVPLATFAITYIVMVYKLKAKVAEMVVDFQHDYVAISDFRVCQGAAVECRDQRVKTSQGVDRSLLSIRAQLATNSLILARIGKKLEIPDKEVEEIERAVNRILANGTNA